MTEEEKKRASGSRYPGASLKSVVEFLKVVDAAGGRASVGHIAPKLRTTETSSVFRSITAAARSFGLAEYDNGNSAVFGLTERGQRAVSADTDERRNALREALVTPGTFNDVGRRLSGRSISLENLSESFRLAGVSGPGAGVAAATFLESAAEASATSGTPPVLDHDLPFESAETKQKSVAQKSAQGNTKQTRAASGSAGAPAAGEANKQVRLRDRSVIVQLDVSGWDVDKVVELVKRLESE